MRKIIFPVIFGFAAILLTSSIDLVLANDKPAAYDKRTGIGGQCIFYEDTTQCRFFAADRIGTVIVDNVVKDIGARSCPTVTGVIIIEEFPEEPDSVTIVVRDCSGDETTFNGVHDGIIPTLKIAG